jgi:transposase
VFPGNTTDVTTVRKIRDDLRGWKLSRTLFVGDAGMNSEENRAELARACGHYVLASRTSGVTEVEQDVLARPGRYKVVSDNLHVKEVVVGDGERRRRYIVCRNPNEAKRQRLHREEVVAELEAELAKHANRSATAKWAAVLRASGRYGPYLRVIDGQVAIDRDKVSNAERFDGKWVLITNDDTLSTEDIATTYKGLLVIERCFRTLKSAQIRVRPMFHRLEARIAAHVRLCVLALLITRVAETTCKETWPRLYDTLSSLHAVEFRSAGQRIFRRSEPTADVAAVLKLLDVTLPKQIIGVTESRATTPPT